MKLKDTSGMPRYTNLMRDEISSKSIVRGYAGEIANNVQSFTFTVGPTQRWKPLLSEWILRLEITLNNGNQLAVANDIAPAVNLALNGWQYIHLYAGNQKIDELSEYVAEVSAIRTRLEKSKAWFDSLGKQQYWESDFALRQNTITVDGVVPDQIIDSTAPIDLIAADGITFAVGDDLTIANAATAGESVITLENGALLANNSPLKPGDVLTFNNATHVNAGVTCTVVRISAADTFEVSRRITAHIATPYVAGDVTLFPSKTLSTITASQISAIPQYINRDKIEIPFKLPLGACYLDEMPTGEYEFRLRGFSYTSFAKRLIESINADKTVGVDFRINIKDMYYYPYIVEAPTRIDSGTVIKTFKCYEAQKKKILTGNNNLQFSIKGNSSAIGFTLQDGRAGDNSLYSPSLMRAFNAAGIVPNGGGLSDANRYDTKISYYQIKYANRFKPEPAQQDSLEARTLQIVQSYYDTYKNSGAYYYEGACESLDDFVRKGGIYFWNFPRDKNTFSSEARIDLRFTDGANIGDNVFCVMFFCYYRTIKLTIRDGKIVGVTKNI